MAKADKTSLNSQTLLTSIIAGVVVGIMLVTVAISLATLIFSGDLSPFLSRGIGLFLFSGLAMGLVVAVFGSLPGTAIGAQDSPAALIALGAASIAAAMAGVARPEAIYHTVAVSIIICSLATGLFFYLIGFFKLGNVVRYIPYPVIGGFLAGAGWLLVRGSLELMTGLPLGPSMFAALLRPEMLARWLPGVGFALVVTVILRRVNHFLVWPGIVFSAIVLFYLGLLVTHTSIDQARADGLLLASFPAGGLWQPILPSHLSEVDWAAMLGALDKFIAIPLVSLIAFLLNASALELVAKRDVDLNHELRVAGLSNLAASLGGGPAGYHLLGATSLAQRMNAKDRAVTITTVVVCALVLLVGGSFISYLPVAFLSGMLLVLGLSFVIEWLWDARLKLPLTDYILVWIILVIVGIFGFLDGVLIGVGVSTILFVFKYSRVTTVLDSLNGKIYHSKVERPAIQRQMLQAKGEQIHIFHLQGFIFFGTASGILTRVRQILEDATFRERFIVLDFHRVHSLDSSAVLSFVRMRQLADLHDIYLVFTQVSAQIRRQMQQGDLVEDKRVKFFPSLDFGMEWCENTLLTHNEASTEFIATSMKSQLRRHFPRPEAIDDLFQYMERIEVPKDTRLIRRGDAPDSMYFIESGRLNIQLETADGEIIRLRGIRSGTVVGEMGTYLKNPRSADVVTTEPTVAYRLTVEALKRMTTENPQAAAALHEWIAHLLAERLADNNSTLEALLD